MATGTTDEHEIAGAIRRTLNAERRERGLPEIPANAPLGPYVRAYQARGGRFAQGQHAVVQRFERDETVREAARRGGGLPRRAPQRGADGRFVQRSERERAADRRTDRQVYASETARLLGPRAEVVQGRSGQALVKVGRGRPLNPLGRPIGELVRAGANEALRLRNEAPRGTESRADLTKEYNRLRRQAQRLAKATPAQTERRGRRADREFGKAADEEYDRREYYRAQQQQRRQTKGGQ